MRGEAVLHVVLVLAELDFSSIEGLQMLLLGEKSISVS